MKSATNHGNTIKVSIQFGAKYYKFVVQKIMESVTNFLTWHKLHLLDLFSSGKNVFLITSQLKRSLSIHSLFDLFNYFSTKVLLLLQFIRLTIKLNTIILKKMDLPAEKYDIYMYHE